MRLWRISDAVEVLLRYALAVALSDVVCRSSGSLALVLAGPASSWGLPIR